MPQIFPSSLGALFLMFFSLFLFILFKFYWFAPSKESFEKPFLKEPGKEMIFFIKW
nr:ATP synthase F0 subunit 8 [Actornithophilus gracilis]